MSAQSPSAQNPAQRSSEASHSALARSESSLPAPKRRKVALACTACRHRKTRCDGRRPSCTTCENRGIAPTCFYEEESLRTQRLVWALEAQLRQHEKARSSGPRQTLDSAEEVLKRAREAAAVGSEDEPGVAQPTVSTLSEQNTPIGPTLRGNHEDSDASILTDGGRAPVVHESLPSLRDSNVSLGQALDGTPAVNGNLDSLYGASSTIAFVRYVFQSANNNSAESHASSTQQPAHPFAANRPVQTINLSPALDVLPRRRVADNYLNCYWEAVHPVFPCLHQPSFQATYDRLWDTHGSGHDLQDPAFLSTLNLCFALGCQFSDNVEPEEKSALGHQFYERARGLVPIDTLDSMSLSVVQSLLLTAIYLQSTQYSSRCWNIAGLAIRAAQSLGLHLDQRVSDVGGRLGREIKRRIWHTCITVDRLLSMIFGRPLMISRPSKVPLPLMTDDEHVLRRENDTHALAPSQQTLFIHSLKLFEILDEVLSIFYITDERVVNSNGNIQERDAQLLLPDVLRLNAALDVFQESIPSYLKRQNNSATDETSRFRDTILQARVLNSRFFYVRLLLLRPVLLSVIHKSSRKADASIQENDYRLDDDLALKMCRLCLDTAHSLISLLAEDMQSTSRNSAWYSVYFAFGAILIVVAAQICPALDYESNGAGFGESWTLAMNIFRHYSHRIGSASRAIQTLKTFRSCLSFVAKEKAVGIGWIDINPAAPYEEEISNNNADLELDWKRFADDTLYNPPPDYYGTTDFNPDPLTDEWFSQQVINLDFQGFT